MRALLDSIGFSDVKIVLDEFEFARDFSEAGIYEAFLASSLHNYYSIIADQQLCLEFKERVRQEFQEEKPAGCAKRIRVLATKH